MSLAAAIMRPHAEVRPLWACVPRLGKVLSSRYHSTGTNCRYATRRPIVMTMREDDWVERLRGEHRDEAIAELRELLVRGLSHSLAQRGGGRSFAEDIAQEATIKILDSLDSFRGQSKFTTWAMTIATRLGISELRRRRYKDVSLDALMEGGALRIRQDDDQADPAERTRILRILSELIEGSLSERQRVAMQALLSGLPVEEIARRTESNRNAVYKLIHDARKKLRSGFEQLGIAPEEITSVLP